MQTIKDLVRNSGFLFLNGVATNILSFIPDMGIHQILVREAAKEPEKAGKLIGNGTIMQVCLSLVALFLAVVLINVMNFPPSTKNALYIASLGLLISGTGA